MARSRYALLRQSLLALSVASTALFSVSSADAATRTWTGSVNSDFNTAGNWSGGVPVAADTGLFNIAIGGGAVTLSAPAIPGSLNFDTNVSSFTLGAAGVNTITGLTAGKISMLSTVAGTGKAILINAPIVLGGPTGTVTYSFDNSNTTASNTLSFGSQVSSGTTGTATLSLTGVNTGANTISGNIVNGAGTTALAKTGAGSWTLSGTGNSYTGATTITGGTLNLGGSLTGGTAITVGTTGTLTQSSGGVISGASGLTINAAGATANLGGTNTYTGTTSVTAGTLNLTGSLTGSNVSIATSGVLNESSTGVIAGSGTTLTVNGATAVANLNGANTYTGATTVSGSGTLNFGNASAIGGSTALNLNTGTIDNTSGLSTLTLSNNPVITFGANPTTVTFTGTNNLNLGTGAVGIVAGLTLNVNNGKTLSLGVVTNTQTTGSTPNFTNTVVNGTGTLIMAGYNIAGLTGVGATLVGNGQISGNGNVIINGTVGAGGTGAGQVTANGTGTLTIAGTLVNAGQFGQSSGTVTLTGTVNGPSRMNLTGGTFLETSTGTMTTIGSSGFTVGGANATIKGTNAFTSTTTVSAGTLTFSGAGAFGSTGSMTLSGGTMTLDNTTAAGGNSNARINDAATLSLAGGTFILKGSDAVATNTAETIGGISGGKSVITISFGGTNTATLTAPTFQHVAGAGSNLINGTNLGMNTAATTSVARLLVSGTAPSTAGTTAGLATGINSAVQNTAIVPFLVGEATSTTGGTGTATGVANTFLTFNATTGLRPLNLSDEFTSNAITAGNNIYVTGATTAATTASINSLIVNGGNLSIDNGVALSNTSGALLFTANSTILPTASTGAYTAPAAREHMITVNPSVTGTISAIIAPTAGGSNALTKSGAGTLVLSGANSYLGTTTINAGVVNVQNATGLGTTAGGTTVTSGGTLQLQNGITVGAEALSLTGAGASGATGALVNVSGINNYGGLISMGAASTISSDAGTLNLTNTGILTGATFVLTLGGASDGRVDSIIGTTSGSLSKTGAGTWALTAANTYTGSTTITAGTLQLGNGGTTGTLAVSSAIVSNGKLAFNRSNAVTQGTDFSAAAITGTGGVTQLGSGITTLSNTANTYTGATTISGGILNAATLAGINVNSSIGKGSAGGSAADLVLNGGTLQYTGSAVASTNRPFTVTTSGGTLDASGTGSGSATFSGNMTASGTTGGQTLTLTGTGSGATGGTMNGAISNGTGTNVTSVTKSGTGTWSLGGLNSYTGTTTITGGTLALTDILNNITGSNKIIVGDTAAHSSAILDVNAVSSGFDVVSGQTLAGHGIVSGTTTMDAGSILSPGNSAGTLSFDSGLTLNNAAAGSLVFDLGTLNDEVVVGGSLTLNSQDINSFTFNTSGGFGAGTYVLFDASGLNGALGSNLTTTISGYNATLSLDSLNSDLILTVAVVPEPGTWAMMIGGLVVLVVIQRRKAKVS